MPKPTECKYCGCDKFNADSVTMTRFRCGSSYWPQAKMWQLSNECAHKCAVQSAEMRERVQRADEALASLPHSLMTPFWREKYLSQMTLDQRQLVDAVDKVREILKGESTEG